MGFTAPYRMGRMASRCACGSKFVTTQSEKGQLGVTSKLSSKNKSIAFLVCMAAAASSSPAASSDAAECSLLGGPFAICVQIGLAAAAIATLVVKRHTERPRRPWLVWFFDASKQARSPSR